jgi:hypothetical protein
MNLQSNSPSLGVLTVATNIYFDYWREMALSLNAISKLSDNIVLHVFTDQMSEVERVKTELKNIFVVGHEIANFQWPEATLLRYTIIDRYAEELSEDILMHLDADMVINQSPLGIVRNASKSNQICLVSHPGYWRPKAFLARVDFYRQNISVFLNDIRMVLKIGGLGSWETDKRSSAYVSRRNRRNYVCGGTWFGKRNIFLKMVSDLSQNVSGDLEQNRIAVWHDESHLNYWASKNVYVSLDPELCFVSTYPQLQGITPVITAIDKKVVTR